MLDHCLDLTALVVDQTGIPLTKAERACVINRARNTEALFAVIRRRIAGKHPTRADYRRAILPALIACLPAGTLGSTP